MKVLMLNGSSNQYGCTYNALNEIKKSLEEENVEVEIFWLGNKAINDCLACNKCENNHCIINDDVNVIIEKMEKCDGLIVGTPVYYSHPSGRLLAFLDRMFYASKNFARKPAAAIACARRAGTSSSLDVIIKHFTISQMYVVSSTYWNMIHGSKPEDIYHDLEGIQTMYNLGKNMSYLLKCLELGKSNLKEPQIIKGNRTNFIR